MPCYHPLKGFRSRTVNSSGKRSIVFNESEGFKDLPVQLPCGRCIGCRLERSRKWAVRCVHEMSLYEDNCFITLTYSPENYPPDGSLQVKHFQDFMKRLRSWWTSKQRALSVPRRLRGKIRFFHCGEYGEKFFRPHYHAILFNFDFPDKEPFKRSPSGEMLFRSSILEKLWGKGFCSIGQANFETAAYVARYILKKVSGDAADEHYDIVDRRTGEIFLERKPEYVTMSRNPGIGKPWFDKFKSDCFPSDFVVIGGKKFSIPKFYDDLLGKEDPVTLLRMKAKRKVGQDEHIDWERLGVLEDIQFLRMQKLVRSFEDGS
nr:MAG: replication initiator protein [Microvirus sp.]